MIYQLVAPVAFFMAISMVAGAGETTSSGGADSAPAYEAAQVAGDTLTISTVLNPAVRLTHDLAKEFVTATYFRGGKVVPTNKFYFNKAKFIDPGATTFCRISALNRNGRFDLTLNGTFQVRRFADDNLQMIANVPDAVKSAIMLSCYKVHEGGGSKNLIRVTSEVISKVFGDIATLKF